MNRIMNKLTGFFRGKRAGFYVALVSVILNFAVLCAYLAFGAKNGFNAAVVIFLLLSLIAEAVSLFVAIDFLPMIAAVLLSAAVGVFIYNTYGTFVDYFNHIKFFGDVTQMGIILTVLILLLCNIFCVISDCAMCRK